MKFKTGLILILLMAHLKSWARETPIIACWDGTFAYNTFKMVKVDDGFEVSFRGATLGNLELHSPHEIYLSLNWTRDRYFVKFKNDQCSIDRNENQIIKKITCLNNIKGHKFTHIFVERNVRNLREYVPVISPFQVNSLKFDLEGKIAQLTIDGARFTTEREDRQQLVLSLRDLPYHCNQEGRENDGGTHWGAGGFPEALRQYLSP